MRNRPYSLIIFMIVLCMIGCTKETENSHRQDAVKLYSQSVRTVKAYIDSMSHAKDSTTLLILDKNFTEDLTDLNFDYPSETDFEISEGENDTLISLIRQYTLLRDSLLYRYAHPIIIPDTLNQE